MIESLSEVMSGQRVTVYGDLDMQLTMHGDGQARVLLIQNGTTERDDETLVLDAHQMAHLTRVFVAMVNHGGNLNARVASPHAGGV